MGGAGGGAYKRARTTGALSAKVKTLQRKVALLRPETKELHTLVNASNITSAAGSITYLSGINQSLTDAGRIGDRVRVTSLSGSVSMYSGAAAVTGNMYSVFIVKDTDSNGVVPIISGSYLSILSAFNPRTTFAETANSDRFKILARKDFASNSYNLGGPQSGTFQKFNIKMNHVLTYRDTTPIQGGAGKNALYMVIIHDDAGSTVDFVSPVTMTYTDV